VVFILGLATASAVRNRLYGRSIRVSWSSSWRSTANARSLYPTQSASSAITPAIIATGHDDMRTLRFTGRRDVRRSGTWRYHRLQAGSWLFSTPVTKVLGQKPKIRMPSSHSREHRDEVAALAVWRARSQRLIAF